MTDGEAAERERREAEEARLAAAAAAGDGDAFATLYERYERRAYNLALRVCGSPEDAADAAQEAFLGVLRRLPERGTGELAFGSYLFTSTRNACYDLMQRRKRSEPTDAIPEAATPLGGPGGGVPDPGDPEEDPGRRQLLDSQRDEVRIANDRLPDRQREVLALRELEELSYDEIAEIMGMNRNSVAQLISRARLNLRDQLRGAAAESIAVAGPECERALPLIAGRQDGQSAVGEDASWLDGHLAGCGGCRLRSEAMQEAGVSYRAWAPVAAAPGLFGETMARAAELVGADWSEAIETRASTVPDPAAQPGMPRPYLKAVVGAGRRRRTLLLAATLGAVALIGLLAAREIDNLGSSGAQPPEQASETRPADPESKQKQDSKPTQKPQQGSGEGEQAAAASEPAPAAGSPAPIPAQAPAGRPSRGKAGLADGTAKTPKPPRTATPPPAPETTPTPEPETTPTPPPEPPPDREPEPPPREPPGNGPPIIR